MIKRLQLLATGEFGVLTEIGEDPSATREAAIVSAVTFTLLALILDRTLPAITLGLLVGLLGLAAWSGLLWVTSRLVGASATPAQLLRGIGYVAPPFVFVSVPILGVTAGIGAVVLQVVAVRAIGRVSTARALLATIPPWILLLLFGMAVRSLSA